MAARRLREALGMTPAHVAHGMRAAYGRSVSPSDIAAWELGEAVPDESELTALAGALWCAPADLLGTPGTLRQYRLARGTAVADLALLLGMTPHDYEHMERSGHWTGNQRQADALANALDLPPSALLELTGRTDELAALLRGAVSTRWQAYADDVTALVPLPRPRVEAALRALHTAYQAIATGSLQWGAAPGPTTSATAGQSFLDEIVNHFWERTG
ncbi:XRE family transcriptional regulator [Streptomyces armeniacus]|uniref:XRE family transcriptional regulator n=1 Tax=Streptomyces armeniacus TaxID=83291 RepID=A0A345Y0I5_9ACTN|nr:XRE family transcriptional regulator [Streptomyces armeniacus]